MRSENITGINRHNASIKHMYIDHYLTFQYVMRALSFALALLIMNCQIGFNPKNYLQIFFVSDRLTYYKLSDFAGKYGHCIHTKITKH